MLTTIALAAALAAQFPESFDLDEARLEIELTCHFATSRFVFSGQKAVLIEDLSENGTELDRHELADEGRFARVVTMLLEGGFAGAPPSVEGWSVIPEDDGKLERFTVAIDGGCRAAVEFEVGTFIKRTEYRNDGVIPVGLADYLQAMHFNAANPDVKSASGEG